MVRANGRQLGSLALLIMAASMCAPRPAASDAATGADVATAVDARLSVEPVVSIAPAGAPGEDGAVPSAGTAALRAGATTAAQPLPKRSEEPSAYDPPCAPGKLIAFDGTLYRGSFLEAGKSVGAVILGPQICGFGDIHLYAVEAQGTSVKLLQGLSRQPSLHRYIGDCHSIVLTDGRARLVCADQYVSYGLWSYSVVIADLKTAAYRQLVEVQDTGHAACNAEFGGKVLVGRRGEVRVTDIDGDGDQDLVVRAGMRLQRTTHVADCGSCGWAGCSKPPQFKASALQTFIFTNTGGELKPTPSTHHAQDAMSKLAASITQ